jgi:hypothetical protein
MVKSGKKAVKGGLKAGKNAGFSDKRQCSGQRVVKGWSKGAHRFD